MGTLKGCLKAFGLEFENALFPEYGCFLCGRELLNMEYHLCDECKKNFPILKLERCCAKCGAPVNSETKFCDNCKAFNYDFDEARASFVYSDTTKSLILGIKYSNRVYLAKFFARMMLDTLIKWGIIFDVIVPVPLSKSRQKSRGYNQSELIADELSKLTKVEVDNTIIGRRESDKLQQNLTRKERFANMEGVFKISNRKNLKGLNVLIIDDIYTTGATANELSKTIRKLHPNKIYVLTAGKTLYVDLKINKKYTIR